MLSCCNKCHKGNDCVRKWILGQKNLPQTCCVECQEFSNCLNANRRNRWEIIHGENFINSENFTNSKNFANSGNFANSESEVLDLVIENPESQTPMAFKEQGEEGKE